MKSKTKLFTLSIYKKDLIEGDFTSIEDCPIARSLKRKSASFDFREGAVGPFDADFIYKGIQMKISGNKFEKFSDRVNHMMSGRLRPEAISIKLYAKIIKRIN